MLFAIQGSLGRYCMWMKNNGSSELSSQDHSATSTFLPSRRLFQGPSLPPSNAVFAHITPGDPPLPQKPGEGNLPFFFPYTYPNFISFLHLLCIRFGKKWGMNFERASVFIGRMKRSCPGLSLWGLFERSTRSDCGGRQWQTMDAGKDDWRTGSGWWKRMFGTSSHPELRHT